MSKNQSNQTSPKKSASLDNSKTDFEKLFLKCSVSKHVKKDILKSKFLLLLFSLDIGDLILSLGSLEIHCIICRNFHGEFSFLDQCVLLIVQLCSWRGLSSSAAAVSGAGCGCLPRYGATRGHTAPRIVLASPAPAPPPVTDVQPPPPVSLRLSRFCYVTALALTLTLSHPPGPIRARERVVPSRQRVLALPPSRPPLQGK